MNRRNMYSLIVLLLILISVLISVGNLQKRDIEKKSYDSHFSTIKDRGEILVKIEDIDYEPIQIINSEGYAVMYVRYKNNSKYYIRDFALEITGETLKSKEKVKTAISYNKGVKKGEKSDNYNLTKTKDDRTKIPIKGYNGKYLREKIDYKINSVRYTVISEGKEYIYEFFVKSKEYKMYV